MDNATTAPVELYRGKIDGFLSKDVTNLDVLDNYLTREELEEFREALKENHNLDQYLDIKKVLPDNLYKTRVYNKVLKVAEELEENGRRKYPVIRIMKDDENAYHFHHDRSLITVLAMIQEPVAGGEFCYLETAGRPLFKKAMSFLAKISKALGVPWLFQKLFTKKAFFRDGQVLIMRGSKILHFNKPVVGDRSRIVLIFHVNDQDIATYRNNPY